MAIRTSGGDKFGKYLQDLQKRMSNASQVAVGFLENAKYPDGTQVALVASVQDAGSPINNIPPRPFFRNTVARKQKGWPKALQLALKTHNYDARKALETVGEGIRDQLKQSIIDTNSPPLSPKTIARKGFAKPLIDTGHMLNSVDKEVT